MRQLDRLLLHRNIQRLGGVQALISAGVFVWGVMKGTDPLIGLGVALFAVNAVLLVWPKIRRGPQSSGLEPAEQRERLDNVQAAELAGDARTYGPRAIGQGIREMFERAAQKKCNLVATEFVAIIDEGDALKGNAFVRVQGVTPA